MFATDGSEYSFNAIRKSIELLNLDDANLTILNIKQGKEALPPEILQDKEWLEKIVNMQEQETIETLEKSELILKEKGFSAQKVLALEGDSAQAILDFTEKYKQDLIVLGSHGEVRAF
ncbi:MAG: universal stress protein [Ignavibacteriales bacterium]|nr:universal stress protein [Ignavibacteriales bacterium]